MTLGIRGISLFFAILIGGTGSAQTVYEKARDPSLRIAFNNQGGLLNAGVCWWHSRLQRAFWNHARFRPDLRTPEPEAVREIIRRLESETDDVMIPGYPDVFSFTSENESLVQEELNRWQLIDSADFNWVKGLQGVSHLSPTHLKRHLDRLYSHFLKARAGGEMLWVLLQAPGVPSHSSLLLDMQPAGSGGYDFEMVDSNFTMGEVRYHFRNGDETLHPDNFYAKAKSWVPYVGFRRR